MRESDGRRAGGTFYSFLDDLHIFSQPQSHPPHWNKSLDSSFSDQISSILAAISDGGNWVLKNQLVL